MAFYYVLSGGTATGDAGVEATKRTGAFESAANNYDSWRDVYPAGGNVPTTAFDPATDIIICAHTHAKDHGGAVTMEPPSNTIKTIIISVDAANQENFLAGAVEGNISSSGNVTIVNKTHLIGCAYAAQFGSVQTVTGNSDFGFTMDRGEIRLTGGFNSININNRGNLTLIDTDLVCDSDDQHIVFNQRGHFSWTGGAVTGTSDIDNLFKVATGRVRLLGVDVTAVANGASAAYILEGYGGNTADMQFDFEMEKCPVTADSGFEFVDEDFVNEFYIFRARNCAATAAAAEHQVFQRTWGGDVVDQDDSGIHRSESEAFPSGTKASLKFTPQANCSPQRPIIFDLRANAALSNASTDTIRIYFAVNNAETLTDQDVWAELIYPDGTNKHIFTYLSNRNGDPLLTSGVEHTADTGSTWLDGVSALTGHNEYYMDLDTSGDAGADGVPVIRIHVGWVGSNPIYFDTTVGVVA